MNNVAAVDTIIEQAENRVQGLGEGGVTYSINIQANAVQGAPSLEATLGRVTVLLGANGAGKSKILTAIRNQPVAFQPPVRSVVYVEGGRVVSLPSDLKINRNTIDTHGTYDQALSQHKSKRQKGFAKRIVDALFALERKSEQDKSTHSDAVEAWQNGGCPGASPRRAEPEVDQLFRLFHEIFPAIELSLDREKMLKATKRGQTYPAPQMSDGERQVFGLLADIAMLAGRESLIVVDEPELNLNALLADDLWTTLETEFPDAVFVYGTHSLQFAMRPQVDRIVVLASDGAESVELNDVSQLDPSRLRAFLGAAPALLAASRAVGVEGTDKSFDKVFFRWIVGDDKVEVVPLGGSEEVRAATTGSGIWDRLAKGVVIAGVVDRDFKSDELIQQLDGKACVVLEHHEAESFLCAPDLLGDLALRLGTVENSPTREELETEILEWAEARKTEVAARRTFGRASLRLAVSLPRKTLAALDTPEDVKAVLKKETRNERAKIDKFLTERTVERRFDEELRRIQLAIQQRDFDAIRSLCPGKELLEALAPKVGCANAHAVALASKKHVDLTKYPSLIRLQQRLSAVLDR